MVEQSLVLLAAWRPLDALPWASVLADIPAEAWSPPLRALCRTQLHEPLDEARRARLHAYCAQDVEVERHLEKRLLALTSSEQELWALDQRINDRGVAIDLATSGVRGAAADEPREPSLC